jgi:hypothetical protein
MSDNLSTYIALKLAALGVPVPEGVEPLVDVARPLAAQLPRKEPPLCPSGTPRWTTACRPFFNAYLGGRRRAMSPRLPSDTFELDPRGSRARRLLAPGPGQFSQSPIVSTYRVQVRAFCTTPSTTAAPPRVFSTSRRAGSRFPAISGRFPRRCFNRCCAPRWRRRTT